MSYKQVVDTQKIQIAPRFWSDPQLFLTSQFDCVMYCVMTFRDTILRHTVLHYVTLY